MRPLHLLLVMALSLATLPSYATNVRFSLVKTAQTETLDAFTYEGGSWTETVKVNHTAVLIQHHAATLLFDTGLGRQVDSQFEEMPAWDKPLLQYGPVTPARDQLDRDGIKVDRILLSHVHWDHASALVDFPEVPVWATDDDIDFSHIATPPAVLPSQFKHNVLWRPYTLEPQAFMGFNESLDLFGDGSLVLVSLRGHTPGSVGLFLTLDDGRRFFFTGDASWRLEGFTGPHEKFWFSRNMVDNDREKTANVLQSVHDLAKIHPELIIVPAHDAAVQDTLGYYPQWVQ